MTALHLSALQGDLDEVLRLLKLGADPAARDSLGRQPLHLAAGAGHAKIVQVLLRHRCVASQATDYQGRPPAVYAVVGRWPAVVQLLDTAGSNWRDPDTGNTLLHLAASIGGSRAYEVLEAGLAAWRDLSVDVANNAGATPLEIAAWNGQPDNVRVLVQAHPEAAAVLVRSAVEGGRPQLVESLLLASCCEGDEALVAAKLLAAAVDVLPAAAAAARASARHGEAVAAVARAAAGQRRGHAYGPAPHVPVRRLENRAVARHLPHEGCCVADPNLSNTPWAKPLELAVEAGHGSQEKEGAATGAADAHSQIVAAEAVATREDNLQEFVEESITPPRSEKAAHARLPAPSSLYSSPVAEQSPPAPSSSSSSSPSTAAGLSPVTPSPAPQQERGATAVESWNRSLQQRSPGPDSKSVQLKPGSRSLMSQPRSTPAVPASPVTEGCLGPQGEPAVKATVAAAAAQIS